MIEISALLACLSVCVDKTTINQLSVIVSAIIAMTGRVTMLGISRWTVKGGSYRTIQRFFSSKIAWSKLQWHFIRMHLLNEGDEVILVGDESVVTKSGKHTHGLDRFFSSLYGKVIPGLGFFTFSLVSLKRRDSHPLMTKQIIKCEEDDSSQLSSSSKQKNQSQSKEKKPPGRPKGSKNKNKEKVELSHYMLFIQGMLKQLLELVGVDYHLVYLVLDGAFGNNGALQMVRRCSMHLISKLKDNSALYFPCQGEYSGRGPHKKYGDKINYDNIANEYLKETSLEDSIQTDIYQMTMLHKLFPQALNVVIIVKTNLLTQRKAHAVLFSSAFDLSYDLIIDYYKLRFQIEFNFRDAKQYWGLEDFMNVKETQLANSVNLAFFMVNLSHLLLKHFRLSNPLFSILDLKAHFRGLKYVNETLKLLHQKSDPILIGHINSIISKIGSINAA